MKNTLCDNLKKIRQARGYTFKELEKLMKGRGCNVSASTLQRYEVGKIPNVPYDSIVALSEIFHVSPCALMGWASGPLLDNIEINLISDFRKLNSIGKEKACDAVRDLTEIARYTEPEEEEKNRNVIQIDAYRKRPRLKWNK